MYVPTKRPGEADILRGLTNMEMQRAVMVEQYKAAIAQQKEAVAVTRASQVRS